MAFYTLSTAQVEYAIVDDSGVAVFYFDFDIPEEITGRSPLHAVTPELAAVLVSSGFTGFEIREARAEVSDNAVDGDVTSLPALKWLKLTGTPLRDDIGELESTLMISERLRDVLIARDPKWSEAVLEVDENGRPTFLG